MSAKHLKLKPHNISNELWWYEANAGIEVVARFEDKPTGVVIVRIHVIPWRSIRAALKRKDKK